MNKSQRSGGGGGFGGRGNMMEMTPEMRQQFQNMRNSGDTAAMRRFREMRGNSPQGTMRGDWARRRTVTQGQQGQQGQRPATQESRPAQQPPATNNNQQVTFNKGYICSNLFSDIFMILRLLSSQLFQIS